MPLPMAQQPPGSPQAAAPAGRGQPVRPLAAAVQSPGPPLAAGRFQPLGSSACRTCHWRLHEAWQASAHAQSATALEAAQRFDPQCQPCHVPLADAFEDGVGCEACHGPGSAYAGLDVMIDPLKSTAAGLWEAAEVCASCHNPNHPFHVERDLQAAAARIHPPPPR
ncbi:MAG TPA: hypothetical protein VGD06_14345 [Acidobacteriota bacterium]